MTDRPPLTCRVCLRLYRLALLGLPPGVRATIGVEMIHAFDMACLQAHRTGGVFAVLRAARAGIFDLVRWLPREWRDQGRGKGGGAFLGGLSREIRHALRFMRRRKAYAALMVLTMAIGIGSNTTVFSLVHGVLLDRSRLPNGDRIVTLAEINDNIDIPPRWVSVPNYQDWKEQASAFHSLGLFRGRSMSVTGGEVPRYVYGAFVTAGFFDAMGVRPALGRVISGPDSENNGPVVVLGHALWQSETGADSTIVGRDIPIDGVLRTVVGVMPPGFSSPGPWIGPGGRVGVWIPFPSFDDRRVNRSFHAVGRLAPGVTLDDARAEMAVIDRRIAEAYPASNADWQVTVLPWMDLVVGGARLMLLLAWASAGFVLLISCVNVAGLVLNHAMARTGEMSLRVALGARRSRLALQLTVENLILSLSGGVIGLFVSLGAVELIVTSNPDVIPLSDHVELNFTVFAVTVVVSLAVGLGISLIAVTRLPRYALVNHLVTVDRRFTPAGRLLKNALVTTQLAVTFVLLVGAGLLTRSLIKLGRVDTGLDAQRVYQASIALSWSRVPTLEQRSQFVTGVLAQLRSIPGVESAGMVNSLPFSGSNAWQPIWLSGEPVRPAEDQPVVSFRHVSPEYFETMGIPVLRGRAFQEADLEIPSAVMVNRSMADRFWPGRSPVGESVAINDAADTLVVVGVVGNVRHFGLRDASPDELYQTYRSDFLTSKSFVVKADPSLSIELLGQQVRSAIYAQDREQPIRDAGPMGQVIQSTTGAERFTASLLGVASAIAVVLAGIGVFGVMANRVLERRKEVAIRLALGCSNLKMFGLVAWSGVRLGLLGSALGFAVSLPVGSYMRVLLYDVTTQDTVTYVVVGTGILSLSLLSGFLPAVRASRLAPMNLLSDD